MGKGGHGGIDLEEPDGHQFQLPPVRIGRVSPANSRNLSAIESGRRPTRVPLTPTIDIPAAGGSYLGLRFLALQHIWRVRVFGATSPSEHDELGKLPWVINFCQAIMILIGRMMEQGLGGV